MESSDLFKTYNSNLDLRPLPSSSDVFPVWSEVENILEILIYWWVYMLILINILIVWYTNNIYHTIRMRHDTLKIRDSLNYEVQNSAMSVFLTGCPDITVTAVFCGKCCILAFPCGLSRVTRRFLCNFSCFIIDWQCRTTISRWRCESFKSCVT